MNTAWANLFLARRITRNETVRYDWDDDGLLHEKNSSFWQYEKNASRKRQSKVIESTSNDVQFLESARMKKRLLVDIQKVSQKCGQPFCCKNLGDAWTTIQIYSGLKKHHLMATINHHCSSIEGNGDAKKSDCHLLGNRWEPIGKQGKFHASKPFSLRSHWCMQ